MHIVRKDYFCFKKRKKKEKIKMKTIHMPVICKR